MASKTPNQRKHELGVCRCGRIGHLRIPLLFDKAEAARMAYYACNACFEATWDGES